MIKNQFDFYKETGNCSVCHKPKTLDMMIDKNYIGQYRCVDCVTDTISINEYFEEKKINQSKNNNKIMRLFQWLVGV